MKQYLLLIILLVLSSFSVADESRKIISSDGDGTIFIELEADTLNPYLQAQTLITLRLYRDPNSYDAAMSFPDLSDPVVGENVVLRSIDINERRYKQFKNEQLYTVTERQYVAYPEQSGSMTIGPSIFKGHIVQGGTIKFVLTESNILEFNVRPIPETYTGNIWIPARSIELYQDFQPTGDSIDIGKPISRNLFISATGLGSGHIPSINSEEIPGFRVYPRQTKHEELEHAESGLIAVMQQEVALVPTAVGKFEIPELTVPWWNTLKDMEELAIFPGKTISILPENANAEEDSKSGYEDNQDTSLMSGYTSFINQSKERNYFFILIISLLIIFFMIGVFLSKRTGSFSRTWHSKNKLLKQALSACYRNDADQARIFIIGYFTECYPDSHIRSLKDIEKYTNSELLAEFIKLESVLYSKSNEAWNGNILAKHLKAWHAGNNSMINSRTGVFLPKLHPLSYGE